MQTSTLRRAVFLGSALAFLATGARAHELTCVLDLAKLDERGGVIGKPSTVLTLDSYPVAIQLDFTLVNDLATKASIAQQILVWDIPYPFVPAAPVTVPPGGSVSSPVTGVIASRADCLAINRAAEPGEVSSAIDFTGHVIFESGQALCTARLICGGNDCGGQNDGGLNEPCIR